MASSKLEIKSLNKTKPFYGHYAYRAIVTVAGASLLRRVNDYNHYLDKVANHNLSIKPTYWNYKAKVNHTSRDLEITRAIIPHLDAWKKADDICIRFENSSLRLFYNDPKMHRKLLKITEHWEFAEADVSPPGIKYFINTPPAGYRTHMSGNRISIETKDELTKYFTDRPHLKPNSTMKEWLGRTQNYSWYTPYASDNYYFDYDDQQDLFMLKLLYPEAIGKTYKLEKKPE